VERLGTPKSAHEILNRLNEVSFNAVLIKELHMMALLRRIADPGDGEGAEWARMRVHMVRNCLMDKLGYSSKLNAEWDFISMLRDEGRKAGDEFLAQHGDSIGKRSTLDIDLLLNGA
jgi:NTE family protein